MGDQPSHPPAAPARHPRDAPPGQRNPPAPRRARAPDVRPRGRDRAGADLVDARRRAAHASTRSAGGSGCRGRRHRRRHAVRRARDARRDRLAARPTPTASSTSRPRAIARRGRRRPRRADRPLPRRVHRPRPLRRARRDGRVDNDATLERYREMALAQAAAGSRLLGLSGMMDGQVAAVRDALDAAGSSTPRSSPTRPSTPRRSTVRSARPWSPTLEGDRRTYQLDPANRREGVREAQLDIAEGADIVMVKPAMAATSTCSPTSPRSSRVPVWAYQVSGEYAMIEAAAANGWIDRERAVVESVPRHPPRRRRRRADLLGGRAGRAG